MSEEEVQETVQVDAVPVPADGAGTAATQEAEWARPDAISTDLFVDVVLPTLKAKVRVRRLENLEATEMVLLPELGKFAALIEKMQSEDLESSDKPSGMTEEDRSRFIVERARYTAALIHRCVMVPDADPGKMVPCMDCGGNHPPALWTSAQARRIDGRDAEVIAAIAEDREAAERAIPFSQDQTPSDSSPSADSGESIPQTSLV